MQKIQIEPFAYENTAPEAYAVYNYFHILIQAEPLPGDPPIP